MATITVGADDATAVTEALVAALRGRGYEVIVHGAPGGERASWAEVGERVGRDVAEGRAESGIACCYTGTGVSIAANKVPGVRAALCRDAETARGARQWNDANVLCLSLDRVRPEELPGLLDAWLADTPVDPEERPAIEHVISLENPAGWED
ncbi:MAG TPA: RpiB/LacA/LacB family sugar-phosphate isomerase [Tepidiformaceae bacterium]|nr:RpiB/LacA/LacB family sugar-phosphate isomerase [Tepidiformaceae bacterium]